MEGRGNYFPYWEKTCFKYVIEFSCVHSNFCPILKSIFSAVDLNILSAYCVTMRKWQMQVSYKVGEVNRNVN